MNMLDGKRTSRRGDRETESDSSSAEDKLLGGLTGTREGSGNQLHVEITGSETERRRRKTPNTARHSPYHGIGGKKSLSFFAITSGRKKARNSPSGNLQSPSDSVLHYSAGVSVEQRGDESQTNEEGRRSSSPKPSEKNEGKGGRTYLHDPHTWEELLLAFHSSISQTSGHELNCLPPPPPPPPPPFSFDETLLMACPPSPPSFDYKFGDGKNLVLGDGVGEGKSKNGEGGEENSGEELILLSFDELSKGGEGGFMERISSQPFPIDRCVEKGDEGNHLLIRKSPSNPPSSSYAPTLVSNSIPSKIPYYHHQRPKSSSASPLPNPPPQRSYSDLPTALSSSSSRSPPPSHSPPSSSSPTPTSSPQSSFDSTSPASQFSSRSLSPYAFPANSCLTPTSSTVRRMEARKKGDSRIPSIPVHELQKENTADEPATPRLTDSQKKIQANLRHSLTSTKSPRKEGEGEGAAPTPPPLPKELPSALSASSLPGISPRSLVANLPAPIAPPASSPLLPPVTPNTAIPAPIAPPTPTSHDIPAPIAPLTPAHGSPSTSSSNSSVTDFSESYTDFTDTTDMTFSTPLITPRSPASIPHDPFVSTPREGEETGERRETLENRRVSHLRHQKRRDMRSISLSSYGFRELINQAIASGEVSPLEAKCMEEGALMLIRREGEEGAEEMKLRPFELLVSESISMAEFLEGVSLVLERTNPGHSSLKHSWKNLELACDSVHCSTFGVSLWSSGGNEGKEEKEEKKEDGEKKDEKTDKENKESEDKHEKDKKQEKILIARIRFKKRESVLRKEWESFKNDLNLTGSCPQESMNPTESTPLPPSLCAPHWPPLPPLPLLHPLDLPSTAPPTPCLPPKLRNQIMTMSLSGGPGLEVTGAQTASMTSVATSSVSSSSTTSSSVSSGSISSSKKFKGGGGGGGGGFGDALFDSKERKKLAKERQKKLKQKEKEKDKEKDHDSNNSPSNDDENAQEKEKEKEKEKESEKKKSHPLEILGAEKEGLSPISDALLPPICRFSVEEIEELDKEVFARIQQREEKKDGGWEEDSLPPPASDLGGVPSSSSTTYLSLSEASPRNPPSVHDSPLSSPNTPPSSSSASSLPSPCPLSSSGGFSSLKNNDSNSSNDGVSSSNSSGSLSSVEPDTPPPPPPTAPWMCKTPSAFISALTPSLSLEVLQITYTIYRFNLGKTKSAIERLISLCPSLSSPPKMAKFLENCKSLSKESISDYISDPGEFAGSVLKEYMSLQSYHLFDFERALRRMLKRVDLPKEGQRIDRVLKCFGYQFFEENRSLPCGAVFRDAKACHSLSFALMMLNTDLHNPNVPNKMTPKQFETNLTGYNGGSNFPSQFLNEIYLRIKSEGILEKDRSGEEYLEMHPDAAKEGWLKCDDGGGAKKRYVVISGSILLVYKKKDMPPPLLTLSLADYLATPLSKEEAKGRKFSFLVHNSNKRVLFSATTQEAVFQWLSAVEMRKREMT